MRAILLVDDHAMFREGLVLALTQAAPDFTVHAVSNGSEAIAELEAHSGISVVMMDYYLPDVGGCVLLRRLRQARPGIHILVLSASEDPDDVHAALSAGAQGERQRQWRFVEDALCCLHTHDHLALANGVEDGGIVVAVAIEQGDRVSRLHPQHARHVLAGLSRQDHFQTDAECLVHVYANSAHGAFYDGGNGKHNGQRQAVSRAPCSES